MTPLEIQSWIAKLCGFPKDLMSIIWPYINGDLLQDEIREYKINFPIENDLTMIHPDFAWEKLVIVSYEAKYKVSNYGPSWFIDLRDFFPDLELDFWYGEIIDRSACIYSHEETYFSFLNPSTELREIRIGTPIKSIGKQCNLKSITFKIRFYSHNREKTTHDDGMWKITYSPSSIFNGIL